MGRPFSDRAKVMVQESGLLSGIVDSLAQCAPVSSMVYGYLQYKKVQQLTILLLGHEVSITDIS